MNEGPVWVTGSGIHLRIVVRPRSNERNLIAEITDEVIVMNLRSPAREGKANTELLKRLSKLLGVSSGDIEIIAGHRSREKTVNLRGVELKHVLRAIEAVTNDK